jgi:hypothetical protein
MAKSLSSWLSIIPALRQLLHSGRLGTPSRALSAAPGGKIAETMKSTSLKALLCCSLVVIALFAPIGASAQCFTQLLPNCNGGPTCEPNSSLLPLDPRDRSQGNFMVAGGACGFDPYKKKICGDDLAATCDLGDPGDPGDGGGCQRDPEGGWVCPAECPACGPIANISSKALPDPVIGRLAKTPLTPSARAILQALASKHSVHLSARVAIALANGSTTLSPTRYEYWESAGNYRLSAPMDPRAGLANLADLAFNGHARQVVMQAGNAKTLAVEGEDQRLLPIYIDNPLFLPLWALSPADNQHCLGCELRLGDLAAIDERRRDVGRPSSPQPMAKTLAVQGVSSYRGSVSFVLHNDADGRLSSAEHVAADGSLREKLVLSSYTSQPELGVDFPRHLALTRYDESSHELATLTYVIDTIEFDVPIPAERFVIQPSEADSVFDGIMRKWLKKDRNLITSCPQ